MDKDEPGSCCIKVSSAPITPAETRDSGRDDDGHGEEAPQIVLVLPANEGVVVKVGAVGNTWFTARMEDHPANVGPKETVMSTIRVQVGIGITMVGTMTS